MKIRPALKLCTAAIAFVALLLLAGSHFVPQHRVHAGTLAASSLRAMPLGLPSEQQAKALLSASLPNHHPTWVDVPVGSVMIRTLALYPDAPGKLPVVVVTAKHQGLSEWVRAVGTEVVSQGLIAIVPDVLSGMGPSGRGTESFASREAAAAALARMSPAEIERRINGVRDYFASQPGSNGKSAVLDFDLNDSRLDAAFITPQRRRVVSFGLTEHAWHNTLPLLTALADPRPAPQQAQATPALADPGSFPAAAANQRKAQDEIAKRNDFPPQSWGGKRMVEASPRHGQWLDIPVKTEKGTVQMRTWLLQPLGTDKAGVVVVIQPSPGMDVGEEPKKDGGAYWMRSVADQVALQGFIVIMPDLTSGLGPNGGNYDSFYYSDDQMMASSKRTSAEKMQFIAAAREYALKLPRANGKSGTLGFCSGGGLAWQSTAAIPGLNAAVSFYGTPPDAATMAKIQAPVIAFAGDNDPGLAPRVTAAAPEMQKLGKTFEYKIYPGTTHAYVYEQHLGQNAAATLDSWPRSMAFLKRYLSGT